MSSVPRATFDSLKTDLDVRMVETVSDFAAQRHLSYDSVAMRQQCSWVEGFSIDTLMFGMSVFPADSDDDGGESLPAKASVFRPQLAIAASLLLALTAGIWGSTSIDGADASNGPVQTYVHDATLPVTLSSELLPDAFG